MSNQSVRNSSVSPVKPDGLVPMTFRFPPSYAKLIRNLSKKTGKPQVAVLQSALVISAKQIGSGKTIQITVAPPL